jgi:Icc-related predicted phosphoesterase
MCNPVALRSKCLTRIFYACDAHGSEIVWKKFLQMGGYHKADVLMMCGDLTGKAIVPIVKRRDDEWYYAPLGREEVVHSADEVKAVMDKMRGRGWYPFETTPKEVEELKAHPKEVSERFTAIMKDALSGWLEMANGLDKGIKVIVSPGNDDRFEIDEVLKANERIIYPLDTVVEIDGIHQLISCEWTNPTPWNTPRQCSEEELRKKLEREFKRVDKYENLICNLHAPPLNTVLDVAPKLDKNLKQVMQFGNPVSINVGSGAVRSAIERYQPLMGLHGHIHEACGFEYIGRTVCINPGSEYESGLLRGYVIDMPPKKFEFWRVEA